MKKKKPPKGYDSWFEYDLHNEQLTACDFHTVKIPYVQQKTYKPDFMYYKGDHTTYIEAKGRFRTSAEARKYVDVSNGFDPEFDELVFLFFNPNLPMPNAKRRKDGTKQTHGEWAERNGFRYYSPKTCPREWKL